MVTLIFIY